MPIESLRSYLKILSTCFNRMKTRALILLAIGIITLIPITNSQGKFDFHICNLNRRVRKVGNKLVQKCSHLLQKHVANRHFHMMIYMLHHLKLRQITSKR